MVKNKHTIIISVVVTAYNCENTILETLQSIASQTFCEYEVIIINDSSTDSTCLIIDEYIADKSNWLLYSNVSNEGVAVSRNIGFALASGEYIAILDSDDIWTEKKLEKQYDFIQKENVDLCYSSYSYFTHDPSDVLYSYITKENAVYENLLKENFIGCSTVVIKRSITEQLKMSSNINHEDYAYWLAILKAGYIVKGMKEVLVKYRFIKHSRSYNKFKAMKNRFDIYYKNEGLGLIRSLYYFVHYVFNAAKKYSKIKI